MSSTNTLVRRLGTRDAVVIGLGSMIGAGIFSAFGPAAQAAGSGLLIGLVIAAFLAYCNATASAQLAIAYPTSGGTYIYGRERLGEWWGFLAGWGFVIGKTASCAAMALTAAAYALPDSPWGQRIIGVVAVIVLVAFNYRGVTRTALLTRVFVSITLVSLATIVVAIVVSGEASFGNLDLPETIAPNGLYGILQAAGLLFFAFAGYARLATMGEEVERPTQTIPRAIILALGITVALYIVVGLTVLTAAGPDLIAASTAPIAAAAEDVGLDAIAPVVRIGAVVASLGALLALIAGIGRTSLAMARNRDLPAWLAAVHPTYRVPHHAEVALGVVVCVLVLTTDLRGAIGFSSFGVLLYYAIANASAYTQTGADRRWPRWLNVVGLAGCLTLVVTLPIGSLAVGMLVFAVGIAGRAIALRLR